jgi:nitrate/nitrite-specific signal transduction histidine kinase
LQIGSQVAAGCSYVQGFQEINLAKEAISNRFRHAQATLVQVSICQVKNGIRLTVWGNVRDFATKCDW